MKVYLIKHKDAATLPINMCAWVDTVSIKPNGIQLISVQAFLRKRDAVEYIKKLPFNVGKYREIVVFIAQNRARTRPTAVSKGCMRRNKKDATKRTRVRKKHKRNMDGGCSCGAPSEVSCAEYKAQS